MRSIALLFLLGANIYPLRSDLMIVGFLWLMAIALIRRLPVLKILVIVVLAVVALLTVIAAYKEYKQ